jgi:hypothetical protein
MIVSILASSSGTNIKGVRVNGRKAKLYVPFVQVTFGAAEFNLPIAIALLIVGVSIIGISIIGILLSGPISSIFTSATASAIHNPQPGTLEYNMTHPVVEGMISFYGFYPTLFVLLGVAGIVLIAAGIISIIMDKFNKPT